MSGRKKPVTKERTEIDWCEVCACPTSQCLVCDKCLTVECWHAGPFDAVCKEWRSAGLITQTQAKRRAGRAA